MATKRPSNVSSSMYSFSEGSDCSDEDSNMNRRQPLKDSKRARYQSSVRERNSKVRRLQHVSSSCDENAPITHDKYGAGNEKEGTHYKKQACNSRNAILARENRLKKKLYLDDLEGQISSLKTQNRKMKITLGTQSSYITDMESELNYLRSVLANSKEISLLLNTVHSRTGLPVSTSLKNNNCDFVSEGRNQISAKRMPIARKTAWSYENTHDDIMPGNEQRDIPTPPTSVCSAASPSYDVDSPMSPFNLDVTSYFSDDDLPIALNDVGLSPYMSVDDLMSNEPLPRIDEHPTESAKSAKNAFLDHNYSSKLFTETVEPKTGHFGVCLHISNKKVSLEFCSQCNKKATANWESAAC